MRDPNSGRFTDWGTKLVKKVCFLFCSASPQVASSNSGDCSFEDDTCGWITPEDRDALDDLNWERMEASKSEFRLPDHTTGTKEGYYMALSRNSVQVPNP